MRIRSAFTLVELLVTTSIIAILMGLLFPVVNAIKERGKKAAALTAVSELVLAVETYQATDEKGRYPQPHVVVGQSLINEELVVMLEDMRLYSRGERSFDSNGLLMDPWRRPYRYQLSRPNPANDQAMANWNWDADAGAVRKQGSALSRDGSGVELIDPTDPTNRNNSQIAQKALGYPYIYSLGSAGNVDDAAGWIFKEDGQ